MNGNVPDRPSNQRHWSLRRSGRWDSFDPNPRTAYYKFLRAVYGMLAWEAWERARHV